MNSSTPKSILEQNIKNLFKKTKTNEEMDFVFKVVNIILLKNSHNNDMSSLFHLLNDYDIFSQIIYLFAGRTVEFPEPEVLRETLLLAICYYYKKLKNKSWEDIERILPGVTLDKLSLAHKIHNIGLWVKQKIQEEYRNLEKKEG